MRPIYDILTHGPETAEEQARAEEHIRSECERLRAESEAAGKVRRSFKDIAGETGYDVPPIRQLNRTHIGPRHFIWRPQ